MRTMPHPIRILIADDHFSARIGLTVPINGEDDMTVVAEASSVRQAIENYRHHRPDVVIMDYCLLGGTGVEATKSIRAEFPEARILMFTILDGEEDIYRAVTAGARGYISKSAQLEELLQAIRQLATGGTYFSPEITEKIRAREQRKPLTPRELEILRCIVHGLANKEIAAAIQMSEGTVKLHISLILDKLGAPDRTRAATLAIERGIVHLGE